LARQDVEANAARAKFASANGTSLRENKALEVPLYFLIQKDKNSGADRLLHYEYE
jgi:hypothetical protein